MDVLWQPMYRDILVQQILPLAPGLVEKLDSGTRVADVACGSGNGTLVMARRFPNSTFVGYDHGRRRHRRLHVPGREG